LSQDNNDDSPLKKYTKYSSLFIQMAVIIVAGTFGGYYFDKWIGLSFPVFTILLSLGSIGIALYLLIKGSY
jgi:hypothetical protein